MNNYFKFMTAALAVTALASCSDTLDFDKQGLSSLREGDIVATLAPFQEEAGTRVGIIPGGQVVWAEDDEVRVYSLDKLTFNSYVLDENQPSGQGAGYPTAAMKENIIQDPTSSDDYAVAQPKKSKAARISSSDNGKALLEAKIPTEYEWATVQDAGVAYKVPSQYWGKVKSTDPFTCDFHALTGFIKLDLADIPAETNSIMITTHEDITFGAEEDPKAQGAVVEKGGANEPLSGVFEAELVDENSKLEASEDLNAKDYFRINFDASEAKMDKILYIPVIAQQYQKLYVIAVKEYGKSKYAIKDGEVLKVWENEEFKVNVARSVALGAKIVFDGTNPAELSNKIAAAYDGKHTVRVEATGVLEAGNLFIANNMPKNNVQITFTQQQTNALTIVEAPAEVISAMAAQVNWGTPVDLRTLTDNGDKARTVSVDFKAGATAAINFYLPTSYVNISAEERVGGLVQILAAKSDMAKPLSPARNVEAELSDGTTISNNEAKDAPIVIHSAAQAITTFAQVFVMPQSKSSAIYVYNPETEITELGIGTRNPGALRLTDALVGTIAYEASIGGSVITVSTAANIYTDGSAAVKDIKGGGNNVKLQADWTGRGLTLDAVQNDYDQAQIYTAAQLQGVGLAAGSDNGTAVYIYKIADKVTDMWLGGSKYPWIGASMQKLNHRDLSPLPTPRTALANPVQAMNGLRQLMLAENIEIDGNHKGLYNMVLSIDDPYFSDPHSCCTSCAANDVKLTENLGLIRNIYTTGKVTVKNFRLNDALIDSKNYEIPYVGSLTGSILAYNDVELNDNETSNVRISNIGGFAGGQFGGVMNTNGNITIKGSFNGKVNGETAVDERFVKTVGSNAGGFIGGAVAFRGYFSATDNEVDLQEVSAEKGSNVGGVAGAVLYGESDDKNGIGGATKVTIPVLFATELAKEATNKTRLNENSGNNVGGLLGKVENIQVAAGVDNYFYVRDNVTVTVADNLTAANQFAGGLIGSVDMIQQDANDDINNKAVLRIATSDESTINVNVKDLEATNGFAGGLVGKTISGDVKVLRTSPNVKFEKVNVTVGTLKTAFAGGGVIGENTDDVIIQGAETGDKLTVTVNGWENTWPAARFNEGYAAMTYVTLKKLCGSFANIIGHQNEDFDIYSAYVTCDPELISDATKKALLFPLHTDATNTTGVSTDPFWGDTKGYVGFSNKTGSYKVNGQRHADQNYNYRKNY